MPSALARVCSTKRCPNLTDRGKCETCQQASPNQDDYRGTASSRGYGAAWRAFRVDFFSQLVEAGVVPACGATLPSGPRTTHSQCTASGLMVFTSADGTSLHLNHEPPLRDDERADPRAVCDPLRIELLCRECHSGATGASQ